MTMMKTNILIAAFLLILCLAAEPAFSALTQNVTIETNGTVKYETTTTTTTSTPTTTTTTTTSTPTTTTTTTTSTITRTTTTSTTTPTSLNSMLVGAHYRGQAKSPGSTGKFDDYTYMSSDADNMKKLGFNVIRLPVYPERLEISASKSEFKYSAEYISLLHQVVDTFKSRGIYVIFDLHPAASLNVMNNYFAPTNGKDGDWADNVATSFWTDTGPYSGREHLKNMWLKLSDEFKDEPFVIAYEIMNEPLNSKCNTSGHLTAKQVGAKWFDICDYVIAAIRANGDNHTVWVPMAPWPRSVANMDRVVKDNNVVYVVHEYLGVNTSTMTCTNNDYNYLKNYLDGVNAKFQSYSVPYVLGEQGFQNTRVTAGSPEDIWLQRMLTISNGYPNCQGWVYYAWSAYGGAAPTGYSDESFWGKTMVSYLVS